jgi:hypothetical protein
MCGSLEQLPGESYRVYVVTCPVARHIQISVPKTFF